MCFMIWLYFSLTLPGDTPMTLKVTLTDAVKQAMKAKDTDRLKTLRLAQSAIKDQEIATNNRDIGLSDDEVIAILQKMVKQRQQSIDMYKEGGRDDLASAEQAEIAILDGFLPQKADADTMKAWVAESIKTLGATGMQDMGKVMGHLKSHHGAALDMGVVGGLVKDALS
jgi:uncharacterized protein YqeY